jgi:hypothetical protein
MDKGDIAPPSSIDDFSKRKGIWEFFFSEIILKKICKSFFFNDHISLL